MELDGTRIHRHWHRSRHGAYSTSKGAVNEESIAMGKQYGDPDRDLGPVMVFLAGDGSRFITGQLLPVDGGQTSVR